MQTVLDPPTSALAPRIVLQNISWATYEALVADHADASMPRFTYDRGVLEIVSPTTEYEERNRALATLVELILAETLVEFRNVGSMTFRREDLARGFEPDSAFYIQHEAQVSGKRQIDLAVDPAPDLVIEVDLFNSSLAKLPLYARLGIPELWRDADNTLTILRLRPDGTAYEPAAVSAAVPLLTAEALTQLMAESRVKKRGAWMRLVRAWVRDRLANDADLGTGAGVRA